MEKFILISTIIHVAAGCIALLSGLLAIVYRKNLKKHRPFGRVYFWCMFTIFITATYLSIYRGNLFLFFIGIFTFHASYSGIRSLKLKKLHQGQRPMAKDWIVEIFTITINLGLIITGIYYSFHDRISFGIISMSFGLLGIRGCYFNIKRFMGNVKHSNYWLVTHISGMLASYIGAITAFTVNNNRWLHLPNLIAWLGPALILIPLVVYETRKLTPKNKSALPEKTVNFP